MQVSASIQSRTPGSLKSLTCAGLKRSDANRNIVNLGASFQMVSDWSGALAVIVAMGYSDSSTGA